MRSLRVVSEARRAMRLHEYGVFTRFRYKSAYVNRFQKLLDHELFGNYDRLEVHIETTDEKNVSYE